MSTPQRRDSEELPGPGRVWIVGFVVGAVVHAAVGAMVTWLAPSSGASLVISFADVIAASFAVGMAYPNRVGVVFLAVALGVATESAVDGFVFGPREQAGYVLIGTVIAILPVLPATALGAWVGSLVGEMRGGGGRRVMLPRLHADVGFLALVGLLGLVAWYGPPLIIPGNQETALPFLPRVRSDSSWTWRATLPALLIGGYGLGVVYPGRGPLSAMLTMVPVAVLATAEALLGLRSHRLLGIEWIVYAAFGLVAVAGMAGGRRGPSYLRRSKAD